MTDKQEGGLLFERLVFFSDAVIAIAITLLVLDLKLPPEAHGVVDLDLIGDKLFGFFLSFAVIGSFWLSHHRLFGALVADDRWVRLANLLFLVTVVFLPFPTSLIAGVPTSSAVVFYALSVSATGLAFTVLGVVARRGPLMRAGENLGGTVRLACFSLSAPLVFLVSAVAARRHPALAMQLWWLIIPARFGAYHLGSFLQRRIDRRS